MKAKKSMKSYDRRELLELILELSEENGALKERINTLEEQVKKQTLLIYEKDSVAEVGIKLTGVFEVIEEAKRKYLKNAKNLKQAKQDTIKISENIEY